MDKYFFTFCFASLLFDSFSALAQSPYAIVARGTEGLIRAYDVKVRDVSSNVPAAPGSATACGVVGDDELTAFYCPQSRSIYITDKTLQSVGSTYGPEGVAVIVAHEYAHARQHAVQGFTSDLIWSSVIDEVQADCVAGVYMKAATPMPISSAMLKNSAKLLESIGDYMPLERNWHGTPQMRRTAFLHGYRDGSLSSCMASNDANLDTIIEKSSDAFKDQLNNPKSELNRLIRWGNSIISK